MKLIRGIGELVGIVPEGVLRKQGAEMDEVISIKDAFLSIEDGLIKDFGPMAECPATADGDEVIDAGGGMVMPAFCDSHTHICFAGSRDQEFIDKINGLSYEEIAARGGGILNSADLLHRTSEEDLYRQTMERVEEMVSKGTGAIEIKSGYGLTTEDELKMLRVIRRIKGSSPALIKATFLGAHAVGRAFSGRQKEYVDLVCKEMIPAVAAEGLAEYVDVFCDEGFFTTEETARILESGQEHGLEPKIHANELACSGGVQVGASLNALSVDHLERTTDAEIEVLKGKRTMPTMLQGKGLYLRRSGSRPGIGLQPWFISFRRHALRNGPWMHQDASHT